MTDKGRKTVESIPDRSDEDLTGLDRIVWNVLTSWLSHLVVIVSGFVLPRVIDVYAGQVLLGVWDFAWSIVSYLDLLTLGVQSSINRYVAMYRAVDDQANLRKVVSTTVFVQMLSASAALVTTILLIIFLPKLFGETLGDEVSTAQTLIALLGIASVIQIACGASRGVLTGCHRWGLFNGIQAGSQFVMVTSMIVVLIFGGGLVGLGSAYLVVLTLTELLRVAISYRICPELRISLSYAKWDQAKQMLFFGGKTLLGGAPSLLVTQTTNIMIVAVLGPAALAVFARPMSLMRHLQTFVTRFSFVMTPTAGALDAMGRDEELRKLALQTVRFGVAFVLPIVLFLLVFGDVLLELWMGKDYANWLLIAVLASGHFLPAAQHPLMTILMGVDRHGSAAIVGLITTLLIFPIATAVSYLLGMSLISVAVAVSVTFTMALGIAVPVYACKVLKINYFSYLAWAFWPPFLCIIPYVLILVVARFMFVHNGYTALIVGMVLGGFSLMIVYWRVLLTTDMRFRIRKKLGFGAVV